MNDIPTNPDHGGHSAQETPAPRAREATQETVTTASIKIMLTQADKQKLRDLGYSDEDVSHMTPDDGAGIIARRDIAPEAGETGATAEPAHESPQRPARPERRPVNIEAVPKELLSREQWVCWRFLWKDGKWQKTPYFPASYAQEPRYPTAGRTNTPKTWRDGSKTFAAYQASQSWSDPFDGIGFVFDGKADKDGKTYAGFDWDLWTDQAKAQCARLNSYSEVSPSGRGIHTIVRCEPFKAAVYKGEEQKAEAYSSGRFFTVTGNRLEGTPATVEDRPEEAAEVVAEIMRLKSGKRANGGTAWTAPSTGSLNEDLIYTTEPLDLAKLASAVMALPDAPVDGDWTNAVCRPLANEAVRIGNDPEATEQLYAMLEARSRLDTEGYDPEANRSRFERCMRDYGRVTPPVLSGTIYMHAEANGWTWTPPDPPSPAFVAGAVHSPPQKPKVTSAWLAGVGDLNVQRPPRPWALGVLASYGEVTTIASPGAVGKTTLGVGLALEAASGRDFLGHKVFLGQQTTLHISSEESEEELGRKYQAAASYHQVAQPDVDRVLFRGVDAKEGPHIELMLVEGRNAKPNLAGLRLLDELIEVSGARVVILDPLNSFIAGGLNDNSAMGALILQIKKIAVARRAATIIMHHTSKGMDLESPEAVMGASAIVNFSRTAITLVRASVEEAIQIGASPHQDVFRLAYGKMNHAKAPDDETWFWKRSIPLHNATADYPSGDSVGVIDVYDATAMMRIGPDPTHERIALRAIDTAPPDRLLSLTKQNKNHYAKPVQDALRKAGVPQRQKGAALVVASLMDGLLASGLIREGEYKNAQRKSQTGLRLTEAGRQRLYGEVAAVVGVTLESNPTAGVFRGTSPKPTGKKQEEKQEKLDPLVAGGKEPPGSKK